MNKKHNMRLVARPLSAAILMALAMPAAFAVTVPTIAPTQVPGQGALTNAGANASTTGLTATASIATTGGKNVETVTLSTPTAPTAPQNVVITWGGGSNTISGDGSIAGFNIGSQAGVKFTATAADGINILNIDASGQPSVILGSLTAGTDIGSLFLANANGIVVGANSVITAPKGLGLINADLTSTQAQSVFVANDVVPISFQGTVTGGVTIDAAANLNSANGVSGFLLVAGAGNVNVASSYIGSPTAVYGLSSGVKTIVDAGVGGYFSASNASFSVGDKGPATAIGSLSASNYSGTGFVYQDAASSAVNLNLGTTTSPYNADKLTVLADGNVNLASSSDLTNVNSAGATNTFNWSGMLTNNGVLDYGSNASSLQATTTGAIIDGYCSSYPIYANTTTTQAGGFDNASTGLVNAGSITFTGGVSSGSAFSNAGTLQMGQITGQAPSLDVTATSGNINIGGTVSVVAASTYNGPLFLSGLNLNAASAAGQTVTVDTNPLLVSSVGPGTFATIAATNVNLDSSLTVNDTTPTNTASFLFSPYASTSTVSGSFVLAKGVTLSADALVLATNLTAQPSLSAPGNTAITSYQINGNMVATGTAGGNGANVTFGGLSYSLLNGNITKSADSNIFNVSGAGSITAGGLTFKNLLGSVNNITTPQILLNGFNVNAPTGGTVNISVDAIGQSVQGFNLNVNGNASISSNDTEAVATQQPANNKNYGQYLMPANANSNLVVQTSGNLTVNAGNGTDNYVLGTNLFQWPGLVYLQANGGQLTSTTAIANAYAAQASTGHAGVFLVANNITDNYPIYTNGNAGVVFVAPYSASQGGYAYASTINGIDPTTANPNMPLVYFATPNPTVGNANFSLQNSSTFTNEYGYQQQNGTFLTLK